MQQGRCGKRTLRVAWLISSSSTERMRPYACARATVRAQGVLRLAWGCGRVRAHTQARACVCKRAHAVHAQRRTGAESFVSPNVRSKSSSGDRPAPAQPGALRLADCILQRCLPRPFACTAAACCMRRHISHRRITACCMLAPHCPTRQHERARVPSGAAANERGRWRI
jgi:hypothetical protein